VKLIPPRRGKGLTPVIDHTWGCRKLHIKESNGEVSHRTGCFITEDRRNSVTKLFRSGTNLQKCICKPECMVFCLFLASKHQSDIVSFTLLTQWWTILKQFVLCSWPRNSQLFVQLHVSSPWSQVPAIWLCLVSYFIKITVLLILMLSSRFYLYILVLYYVADFRDYAAHIYDFLLDCYLSFPSHTYFNHRSSVT